MDEVKPMATTATEHQRRLLRRMRNGGPWCVPVPTRRALLKRRLVVLHVEMCACHRRRLVCLPSADGAMRGVREE